MRGKHRPGCYKSRNKTPRESEASKSTAAKGGSALTIGVGDVAKRLVPLGSPGPLRCLVSDSPRRCTRSQLNARLIPPQLSDSPEARSMRGFVRREGHIRGAWYNAGISIGPCAAHGFLQLQVLSCSHITGKPSPSVGLENLTGFCSLTFRMGVPAYKQPSNLGQRLCRILQIKGVSLFSPYYYWSMGSERMNAAICLIHHTREPQVSKQGDGGISPSVGNATTPVITS